MKYVILAYSSRYFVSTHLPRITMATLTLMKLSSGLKFIVRNPDLAFAKIKKEAEITV